MARWRGSTSTWASRSYLCRLKSSNMSGVTRNLILDHANSNQFQRHYLGRQLAVDSYALIRGLEPQNALAVIDIENQLAGLGFVEEPAIRKSSRPRRPAQKRLMDALTAPVESTVEGQHRRIDVAIYAVMAYYVVVEGPAKTVVIQKTVVMQKTVVVRLCCLALRLEPDDPCIEELKYEFYSAGDLNHKIHLQRHALQIHSTVS
ncbi:hypothetical protein B0T26DRAFT_671515 [Lasiosphaeria miniovina]|uniref:Uncharacterized protein n=1 Tax=Lasiosphaeria miniovina TaxID=1954250 RepID=A0AA40B3E6_9PEZI|nr:uncharacterized protein B0T26DRAFT_671515 [Lasiosphaeria miniovina]KAK0726752.1 hypothetical protein B0T26DRAFT_671515 [Lasiosphaeria miniovina]